MRPSQGKQPQLISTAGLNDPQSVATAAGVWTAAWGTYAMVGGFGLVGALCAFRPFVVLYGYAIVVSLSNLAAYSFHAEPSSSFGCSKLP